MDLYYYKRLEDFINSALPNIYLIDLSDEKTRQANYDRFMESYIGGRVLVIYTGAENKRVARMVANIREEARRKLGPTYLFDPHNVVKVPGFKKELLLLQDSKYG